MKDLNSKQSRIPVYSSLTVIGLPNFLLSMPSKLVKENHLLMEPKENRHRNIDFIVSFMVKKQEHAKSTGYPTKPQCMVSMKLNKNTDSPISTYMHAELSFVTCSIQDATPLKQHTKKE